MMEGTETDAGKKKEMNPRTKARLEALYAMYKAQEARTDKEFLKLHDQLPRVSPVGARMPPGHPENCPCLRGGAKMLPPRKTRKRRAGPNAARDYPLCTGHLFNSNVDAYEYVYGISPKKVRDLVMDGKTEVLSIIDLMAARKQKKKETPMELREIFNNLISLANKRRGFFSNTAKIDSQLSKTCKEFRTELAKHPEIKPEHFYYTIGGVISAT